MISFKDGFKRARKGTGLSQEGFARKYNFSLPTIKKWEQGKAVPEYDTLVSLCEIFQCDMSYLFYQIELPTHDLQFIHEQTGLSKLAVENLTKIHTFSNGSDFWSYILRFLNFLLEGARNIYSEDEANIIPLVIKAHEAMEAASNAKKLEQLLNSKLALSDAEISAWKNWDFTKELLDKEYDRTKVLDEVRKCRDVYDAKLYHCEKEASALIAEYIKKGGSKWLTSKNAATKTEN